MHARHHRHPEIFEELLRVSHEPCTRTHRRTIFLSAFFLLALDCSACLEAPKSQPKWREGCGRTALRCGSSSS